MTLRSKSKSPNKLKVREHKYNKYLKQRNILLILAIIELIIICVQQI